MIFRQLFDRESSTYTYLIARRWGGEAVIIDPVLERVDQYLRLLKDFGLTLVKAIDTHLHADHKSGLGALRDKTRCITVMGAQSRVDVVAQRVSDGDLITVEGLCLEVMYTPGHTDDSYCFRLENRLFTGDTLLIRRTGRTDFQNGDPRAQYDSIFNKLLPLPDDTLIYPAHDYDGNGVSTIREERLFNPRLRVNSVDEYVELMNSLHLPDPRMMNIAVPSNLKIGWSQQALEARGLGISVAEARQAIEQEQVWLVDLRETAERQRQGWIPGSIHVPYGSLTPHLKKGGMLRELAAARSRRRLLFYCAYGERSGMAVEAAQDTGLYKVSHLSGGLECWIKQGGSLSRAET
jgi:sulfur dioxygenase